MKSLADRQVVVPARALDDLTELTRLAADRLADVDPSLAGSLRGATADVRTCAVLEP